MAGAASITGSDTAERFHTDDMLRSAGIHYSEGWSATNLADTTDLVIHSVAYEPSVHEERASAVSRGIPLMTYPQALGELSRAMGSVGIAGVHGKTTTAALCAAIVKATGFKGAVLVGSALSNLGGRATLVQGGQFFIAETCEYRRSFLSFRPSAIVVTSIEADHLDYFADEADVMSAFIEYASSLPEGGELIYCADDRGASALAETIARDRPGVMATGYGETAEGEGRVVFLPSPPGETRFTVGRRPFALHVPGRHNALNTAAAVIATDRARQIAARQTNAPGGFSSSRFAAAARDAVQRFTGTRRRSEIVGDAGGVLVLDDYAHHPTAIAATLDGFREFYPGRRIVLDFMPHTYSRTRALMDDFGRVLAGADVLLLHEIYASAREENPGDVRGDQLADVAKTHGSPCVHFVPEVMEALPLAERIVEPGDLFVTMGAGNNWELGRALVRSLKERDAVS